MRNGTKQIFAKREKGNWAKIRNEHHGERGKKPRHLVSVVKEDRRTLRKQGERTSGTGLGYLGKPVT